MKRKYPKEADGLGPIGGGNVVVGMARGVNDASSVLVRRFIPTRYELEIICRHYVDIERGYPFSWVADGTSSGSEVREVHFASRRLLTLRKILGKEVFESAVKERVGYYDREIREFEEFEENMEPCKCCGQ